MTIKPIRYNNVFAAYTQSGQLKQSRFAEIIFINLGTTTCVINSTFPLPAGGVFATDGKQNEQDITPYQIFFSATDGNLLVVVCKYYNES